MVDGHFLTPVNSLNVLRPRKRGCIWSIHHQPNATFLSPTGAKEEALSVCLFVCVSLPLCILHSILKLSSSCHQAPSQQSLSCVLVLSHISLMSFLAVTLIYLSSISALSSLSLSLSLGDFGGNLARELSQLSFGA